jgi:dihydroxyacetone kinase
MSLSTGFKVLKEEWEQLPKEDIGVFLKECGMLITEHCGGASGPIWGSAFRGAGKYAAGKTDLDVKELGELLNAAVEAIQKRGGAKLGDKTLLDALIPAAEDLLKSGQEEEDMAQAMKKSAAEAVSGAERTKDIIASRGRASYLGERSLNYPDAGAMAIGIIFNGISEKF